MKALVVRSAMWLAVCFDEQVALHLARSAEEIHTPIEPSGAGQARAAAELRAADRARALTALRKRHSDANLRKVSKRSMTYRGP
jgi:hypothetical protein